MKNLDIYTPYIKPALQSYIAADLKAEKDTLQNQIQDINRKKQKEEEEKRKLENEIKNINNKKKQEEEQRRQVEEEQRRQEEEKKENRKMKNLLIIETEIMNMML